MLYFHLIKYGNWTIGREYARLGAETCKNVDLLNGLWISHTMGFDLLYKESFEESSAEE